MLTDDERRTLEVLEAVAYDTDIPCGDVREAQAILDAVSTKLVSGSRLTPAGRGELDRLREKAKGEVSDG